MDTRQLLGALGELATLQKAGGPALWQLRPSQAPSETDCESLVGFTPRSSTPAPPAAAPAQPELPPTLLLDAERPAPPPVPAQRQPAGRHASLPGAAARAHREAAWRTRGASVPVPLQCAHPEPRAARCHACPLTSVLSLQTRTLAPSPSRAATAAAAAAAGATWTRTSPAATPGAATPAAAAASRRRASRWGGRCPGVENCW